MVDPVVIIDSAVKRFTQGERVVTALDRVSLSVEKGAFIAIMGSSGSGKSTLLHLMAGLTRADEGRVMIDGTDLGTLGDRALTLVRRRKIGLVFQAFNLVPTLTAYENVALPLMLDGKFTEQNRGKISRLFETLDIAARAEHRPDALSGGEQQRIAIGRALITDPAVILADEPTGNLDTRNSDSVCRLLYDLSANHGRTIVMVTHEPSVAIHAKEVVVLRDGKLVERFETNGIDDRELAARYQGLQRV